MHSSAVRHAKIGALAHLARALDWQSKGDRFESDMLHIESGCIAAFLLLPAQEKMPFSARNASAAPFAQDLGHFPARQAGGILFCAGKDAFVCLEPPRSTFCAGCGAFSCPAGGWYPIPRRKRCLFLPGTATEHLLRRIWGIFLPGRRFQCGRREVFRFVRGWFRCKKRVTAGHSLFTF